MNDFPYTNFHDLNLDWILKEFKSLGGRVDEIERILADDTPMQELVALFYAIAFGTDVHGDPLPDTSEFYHNNCEYFKEVAEQKALLAGTSATQAAASVTQCQTIQGACQAILDSIPEDYTQLTRDVNDLKNALSMRNRALADIIGFTALDNNFQTGAYASSGPPVTANTGRAYCIFEGISKGSKIYFDATKYLINYYYITSTSDYTRIYTPNAWNDTGEITLDYMDNGTVFVQVKRTGSTAYLANLLNDINGSVIVYRADGTNFNYNGTVSGTTLAGNNKVGIYALGGSSTAVVSNMTDMPVSDFGGGYLLNTLIGSAGTTVQQTLVEYAGGTNTTGRTFRRTIGGAWHGLGQFKWVAFGDSITHGSYSNSSGQTLNGATHSYAYRIAKTVKRQDVAEFYNCAVRGIGWINTGNNGETFADMMALFTGDKTSINLVTVMLGINDYISSETLGTTSSAENDGTISGAIRYGLKYICENYPNAKVIAISPLNSMNHGNASNGWSRNTRLTLPGTLQDVCDMIAYWCNVYGVKYVNEISDSFINNYNISSYLKDNLHPTDEGQWMLAYELAEKIF